MKNKFIILICAFFCAVNLFGARMTEVGVGVYIYDHLLRRCADSWGKDHKDFAAEHFAILEKNGVNVIHLALESLDLFENLYLPLLEKHNIKALIQINYAYFRNGGNWTNPEFMDRMAKKASIIINKYKNHPNVVAFSIREEAGRNQMKLISDYYKNIFKYTGKTDTFVCHNDIGAARAHIEPYPEIFGTDRYNFYFSGGKNYYLASPSYAINWLRGQAIEYSREAAKRNSDFMMVLTSGGSLMWFDDMELGFPNADVRAQMQKLADEENMGWFKLKTGQPAYWKWYKMPANCLKACMWVSVLEGAKYVTFYSYRPLEKGRGDIDTIGSLVKRAARRRYSSADFFTLAGHPDKPNPQLAEFAETAKELKVYGKLIMKMKKVVDDKSPVVRVIDFPLHYAQRFTVDGIKGSITVICNVNVGTWPNNSRNFFRKTDKIKIGKDGEMVGYVPRKGEDIMTVFPKLAKGEAFFRLDNMQNVKGFKVGIKPGSGIMLFTGTKEEFNKLQKLIK